LEYSSTDAEIWPNFFIVGAAKAGTTSLYSYLKQHPQVYMSPMKEPHYFSQVSARYGRQRFVDVVAEEPEYLALFKGAGGYPAVGEASTSYLGFEDTAEKIYERLPEAGIIILLRDPIERAYSHYLMDVRQRGQKLSFYDAIVKERQEPEFGWDKDWHRYTELYYPKVKRYLDVFGPSQVLVLLTEFLQRNPSETLEQTTEFLGLDVESVSQIDFTIKRNLYTAPRNKLVQAVTSNDRAYGFARTLFPKRVLRFIRDHVLFKHQEKPAPDAQSVNILRKIYEDDTRGLEDLLSRSLPELRRSWAKGGSADS
jgi:hypothetical protein